MNKVKEFHHRKYENGNGLIAVLCFGWWLVNTFKLTIFNVRFLGGNNLMNWVVLAVGVASVLFLTRISIEADRKSKRLTIERRSLFRSSKEEYPFEDIKDFFVTGERNVWRKHATHDTLNGSLKMTLRDDRVIELIKWSLGRNDKLSMAGDLHAVVGLVGALENK